jgi:uncharacterized membrane protein
MGCTTPFGGSRELPARKWGLDFSHRRGTINAGNSPSIAFHMRRPFIYSLISVFAAAGSSLSGYLSYVNLWGSGCEKAAISCSASASGPVMILGLPNCVYGFAMFFVVLLLALMSIARDLPKVRSTIFWLSIVGTLFALGLSIYEIYWLDATSLPACVYGLIFYAGIYGLSLLQRRSPTSLSSSSY